MTAPAPIEGYGANPGKRAWRHVAYQFSDRTAITRKRDRVVACLDSAEGCEVRHALALGFDPDRIHVFNTSAAILAHLTRGLVRDGLPRVPTHARTIAEAGEVLGETVDVLSLDFTGPAHAARLQEINHAVRAVRPGAVVMVNVLAAREQGAAREAYARYGRDLTPVSQRVTPTVCTSDQMAMSDVLRIDAIACAVAATAVRGVPGPLDGCRWCFAEHRTGRYMSGPLPFVWAVMRVAPCGGVAAFARRMEDLAAMYTERARRRPATVHGFAEWYRTDAAFRSPFLCPCERQFMIQEVLPAWHRAEAERTRSASASAREVARLNAWAADLHARYGATP